MTIEFLEYSRNLWYDKHEDVECYHLNGVDKHTNQ